MRQRKNYSGFAIGNNIILRAIEPEDLDFLYRLENDAAFWHTSENNEPRSRYGLKHYLAQCTGDFLSRGSLQLVITNTETGETLGYVELYNLLLYHRRAEVGILIAPEHQQKGLGTQVLKTWIPQALKNFGLHKIVAYVVNNNIGSLKAFKRAGFHTEATLKEWFWNEGEWHDVEVLTMNLETVGTSPER